MKSRTNSARAATGRPSRALLRMLAVAALLAAPGAADAQTKLKVAAGQRGNWDSSVAEVASRMGMMKKHGVEVEILYTQGAGETQQAVISGSVDIGVAAGVMGVLGAYSKGAPVRVIANESTGAQDLYWYVRADSPIKSWADTDDKTLAYSTNGSSTHGVVQAFMSEKGLKAKLVATGGPPGTLTQVMSGQIDIGWAAPPFGLDQLDRSEIRVLAKGSDTSFGGQTVRFNIVTPQTLASKKEAIESFARAYREAVEAMYSDPKALTIYAEWLGITEKNARRTRDDFFPKESLDPDRIIGIDVIVKEAVKLKYTAAPLTDAQLAELIQLPPK